MSGGKFITETARASSDGDRDKRERGRDASIARETEGRGHDRRHATCDVSRALRHKCHKMQRELQLL